MTNERDTLRAVKEYLTLRGYKVYRINNAATFIKKRNAYAFHGSPGFPDLVAVLPGKNILFVECKSERGKQTPEQKAFEQYITGVPGCHYFVIRDVAEIIARTETGRE